MPLISPARNNQPAAMDDDDDDYLDSLRRERPDSPLRRDLFRDIQDADLGEAQISKPNPTYLLLAMLYLKTYPTKHALAARRRGI
jgi:hypothetical protein